MENLFYNNSRLFFDKVLDFTTDFTRLIFGVLSILVSAVIIYLSWITYRKIRRRFPVKVNCWFCCNNTKVPYSLSNSWECPHCNQYNGFNKDGDYNKVIREQYNSKLNEDIFNTLKTSFCGNKFDTTKSNGFCKLCNINQQLKIQQLALFVPLNEDNYFEEIEEFREKLEKAYQLCSKCEKTLKETLEKQEYNLLQNRLNAHKGKIFETSPVRISNRIQQFNLKEVGFQIRTIGVQALRWICVFLDALLLFALLLKLESERQFKPYRALINYAELESLESIYIEALKALEKLSKEVSFAGFLVSLLSHSVRQTKVDQVNLLFWGLFHIILWSTFTTFQTAMCGISLYLNIRTVREKQIYLSKNSIQKKSGFQPEALIFPKAYNFPSSDTIPTDQAMFSPIIRKENLSADSTDSGRTNVSRETKMELPGGPMPNEELKPPRKARKKECEIESLTNEDKQKRVKSVTTSCSTTSKANHLNSSVFSKSFLASLDSDKNEEESSEPFDEVYNNLSGLNLGEKRKKSKKHCNFLFENRNFSERKSPPSVIRPAKFVKNVSNSWTSQELAESASRSSTPSSGYSSQKPEKAEANRFDFAKSIAPISVNPYSRPNHRECFDCYEGSNGFYNNFNCFSPGFVPFQHFPGPVGHTTVYTYTRPTNFHFPFAPQPFSNYKISPSSSPRLSDVSDCDNLFQNTSKNFESSKRWFKLKKISYYFSVFLNLVTLLVMIYFASTGMILIDWKLPRLNFFF